MSDTPTVEFTVRIKQIEKSKGDPDCDETHFNEIRKINTCSRETEEKCV